MVYLNFNNLDTETQQQLLTNSKKDIEGNFGEQLKRYAEKHHLEYEKILQEEAERNLYQYQYVFTI